MDARSSAAATLSPTSPTDNVTCSTVEDATQGEMTPRSLWRSIVLGVIQYVVVCVTVAGNALVLVAVARTRRLQTTFNMYVVNLALTDVLVALTAMTFYSTDQTLGYWPFGEFMCGVWIFFDYGTTFASVFTLIAISLDRLWSVMWSAHYRSHRTRRKTAMSIAGIWVTVLLLWLPPCIADRTRHTTSPGKCIWDPAQNHEFVVVIAVVGHHGACITILTCYLIVFLALRGHARRIVPTGSDERSIHVRTSQANSEFRRTEETAETLAENILTRALQVPPAARAVRESRSGEQSPIRAAQVIAEGAQVARSRLSEKCAVSRSGNAAPANSRAPEVSKTRGSGILPRESEQEVFGSENRKTERHVVTAPTPAGPGVARRGEVTVQGEGLCQENSSLAGRWRTLVANTAQGPQDEENGRPDVSGLQNSSANNTSDTYLTRSARREKRTFVTLSYIVVGFMVCWLPFHLVFDVTAARPELVPEAVYSVTFWMTYVNSAVNPILYNFSSSEFRRAFKEMFGRK